MTNDAKELEKRICALPDDELMAMVFEDFMSYRKEALRIADEEIERRGILDEINRQDFSYLEGESRGEMIAEIIRRENLKDHFFIRIVVEISQKIKKLRKNSDKYAFLINSGRQAFSRINMNRIIEEMQGIDLLEKDETTVDVLTEALGPLSVLLSSKIIAKNHNIETLGWIVDVMANRLCADMTDEELVERAKLPFVRRVKEIRKGEEQGGEKLQKCRKRFKKMVFSWFNAELFVIANAESLSAAWRKVLEGPDLSENDFNNLLTSVKRRLALGME